MAEAEKNAAEQEPMTLDKLQGMIDDGQITSAQAMEYVSQQSAIAAVAKVKDEIKAESEAEKVLGKHAAVIARYQKVIPGLLETDSDDHKKVAETFKRLVAEGYQDDASTERTALLETYGKITNVERAKAPKPESFQDGGSGADDGEEGMEKAEDKNAPPSSFSQRERDFYGKMIAGGHVKSWADAKTIVQKRGNPALRASMKDTQLRQSRI